MYQVNEVLELEGTLYRVLKIVGNQLVWIPVENKSSFPSVVQIPDIEQLVIDEKIVRADDPFAFLQQEMPAHDSSEVKIRDKNYKLLTPLIEEPFFYIPRVRGKVIRNILESGEISKPYLYRIAKQYWQRGQIPNALLPDYRNSGAKGKRRVAKGNKLGRPRIYSEGTGALIDEATEKLFRIVIDKYLLKGEFTLPFVHRRLKILYDQYFPATPESEKPTKWQLKYFYDREYGFAEKISNRTPELIFKKDVRPLTSTATIQASGPGSRFEIDATIADIYLVSDVDRTQPVGRPILYIVIDVFSRFIVGWYIGFENPSYVAAIQALYVAMTDKSEFIKSQGIKFLDMEWPTPGLPEVLLADRGELLGYQIEGLESGFPVRIENTPPYRGDAKGIVERSFEAIQAEFKPFAPGVVTGTTVRKRGGRDYRLDSKLTVSEFKEIIISSIIMHNFVDPMEKYDRSADMPSDLPGVPIHLWNWGLQNRTGRLRIADSDSIRITLLPREQATTSEKGVCLFGLYYSSAEVIATGWMHRTKHSNRPKKITVAYDPNVADEIYLFYKKNSREYWTCNLTDLSREYRGNSFWEVWRKQEIKKKGLQKLRLDADKTRALHEDRVLNIIKSAEKKTTTGIETPKSERLANIGKARTRELERERADRKPSRPNNLKSADVLPFSGQDKDNADYPLYLDELFGDDGGKE